MLDGVLLFKAVIFDWDGTLADTKDLVLASFRKALEDLPVEVDEKLIKSLMGKRAKEIFLCGFTKVRDEL